MIVVIPSEVEADALDRALRQGGFVLRSRPGGIFELRQVARGKPVCARCEDQAQVNHKGEHLCVRHYHAS